MKTKLITGMALPYSQKSNILSSIHAKHATGKLMEPMDFAVQNAM